MEVSAEAVAYCVDVDGVMMVVGSEDADVEWKRKAFEMVVWRAMLMWVELSDV